MLVLFFPLLLFAQILDIETYTDKVKYSPGEEIVYNIEIEYSDKYTLKANWEELDFTGLNLKEVSNIKKIESKRDSGTKRLKKSFKLETYKKGAHALPLIDAEITLNEKSVSKNSDEIFIEIDRKDEGDTLRDIRSLYYFPYYKWPLLLLILVVIICAYLFYKKRKKKVNVDHFKESLNRAENLKTNDQKKFYFQATEIVKKFLDNYLEYKCMGKTSEESEAILSNLPEIKEFLKTADKVKFANLIFNQSKLEEDKKFIISFIMKNKKEEVKK